MPVCLVAKYSSRERPGRTRSPFGRPCAEQRERPGRSVAIGLVNNMPDGALEATERQFLSLLDAASGDILVRLSLYAMPEIVRNEAGGRHVESFYANTEDLWGKRLDGLIVTGREPLSANLKDEPYWQSFTRLLEWAQENTYATVWSCLAAHAAVLHMDGVERIRSREKLSGIFECARLLDHALTAGTASSIKVPHSRWNGLPEDELTRRGYSVLTRTADAGVDTFVKRQKSLFVFFQGHPEYESNTLLLEYRRDAGRYLRGEASGYPSLPRDYFDEITINLLVAIEEKAKSGRSEELLTEVSTILGGRKIANTWHSTAAHIYRNWLEYICEQKLLSSPQQD
jgi:homoserine O-succinyltransferase/O-acetyltransferase